jgi:hypothetical protein
MKDHVIKTLPVSKKQGLITLDTREIPSGIYLYSLIYDKGRKSGKFSIIH